MLRSTLSTLLAATAAVFPGGTTAIKEINVFTCMFSPGYLSFSYTVGNRGNYVARCFAESGETDVNQEHVTSYCSGNNAGWFEYEPGDEYLYRHYFNKSECFVTHSRNTDWGRLVKIHIN
ncbi:hypothetical protein NOR_07506 [Metarhizium rileyi]|uniref:Streptomyces killer toxin-like beta/gamma crystallin domain-containing protein n=1 Tax=Metarhizium rileyi (strain RCEF 4871) TaxID=1649241 RepID=A0A166Y1K3_METRR|nr:hypothetical protein NOR_07506 [Metarhizium rileyi RCEF 4871]TWU72654.1 hypothetical protein ED733_002015 [Metarhizium rileyi]